MRWPPTLTSPVSHLSLMTDAERRQLLVGFNHTSRPFPADKCVHELIQRQVELTPQATAVVSDQRQITYRELNERANQLARHLRSLSGSPEQVVAICLDSSVELVVSMLAVSKAGAAYLPLDPRKPQAAARLYDRGFSEPDSSSLAQRFPRSHTRSSD